MPLPILSSQNRTPADPATLLRLLHQSDVAWSEHLADQEQPDSLQIGRLFANSRLTRVPEANRIVDASADPAELDAAIEHYRKLGTRLAEVIPAVNAGGAAVTARLKQLGWKCQERKILRLVRRAQYAIEGSTKLKVIPARASFLHVQRLVRETQADEQQAEAAIAHLDDPHVDALLAMDGAQPVGCIAMLTMGEVGRIQWMPGRPDQAAVRARLMGMLLDIAGRGLLRHVLAAEVLEESVADYAAIGFTPVVAETVYYCPDSR
jgi:hypothetical protein